jgi:hypothetical protein
MRRLNSPGSRGQAKSPRIVFDASSNWSLWISFLAIATTTSQPQLRERLGATVVESYASVTEFWEENYLLVIEYLGFRVRHPRILRQSTIAVTVLTEGLAMRQPVDGCIHAFVLPTGPAGEDQEQTLFATGLDALAQQFFEPDPDFGSPNQAGRGRPRIPWGQGRMDVLP